MSLNAKKIRRLEAAKRRRKQRSRAIKRRGKNFPLARKLLRRYQLEE